MTFNVDVDNNNDGDVIETKYRVAFGRRRKLNLDYIVTNFLQLRTHFSKKLSTTFLSSHRLQPTVNNNMVGVVTKI